MTTTVDQIAGEAKTNESNSTASTPQEEYYAAEAVKEAYTKIWGEGNIHGGYFPHLVDSKQPVLSYAQAAEEVTFQMAILGEISESSVVLDLGCGYGKALYDVCKKYNCTGVGVDLSEDNIKRCLEYKQKSPELNLNYVRGSFTDVPADLKQQKFTHIISQFAFCHVHKELNTILQNAKACLQPGGVLVCFDYLGPKNGQEPPELVRKHGYERLTFTYLAGHEEYKRQLAETGFEILQYKELDDHFSYGYNLIGEAAKKAGIRKVNGDLLSEDYFYSAKVAKEGWLGMNLFSAKKL